jgi:hypothetical protein
MDGIYNTDNNFDFHSLHLAKPQQIPGGSYFIRFSVSNSPLYIRLPKCNTKQGFLKAGKRFYTDFMFSNENSDMIEWMEKMETFCQDKLFENRNVWFEGDMEMHDIENYFTSPLKLYKSGKYYLARANVSTNLGKPNLKIYDEQEKLVAMDDVNDKQKVVSIVEVKGIKCSATSFQIEMEIKQMMVMEDSNLFDNCLFKSATPSLQNNQNTISTLDELTTCEVQVEDVDSEDDSHDQPIITLIRPVEDRDPLPDISNEQNEMKMIENHLDENVEDDTILEEVDTTKIEEETEIIPSIEINETLPNELEEVDIPLEKLSMEDSFSIRNKNSVYYEMYKEAKRKARVARDLANSSYLEARRIKNLYMLEDTSDSEDSDFDND